MLYYVTLNERKIKLDSCVTRKWNYYKYKKYLKKNYFASAKYRTSSL